MLTLLFLRCLTLCVIFHPKFFVLSIFLFHYTIFTSLILIPIDHMIWSYNTHQVSGKDSKTWIYPSKWKKLIFDTSAFPPLNLPALWLFHSQTVSTIQGGNNILKTCDSEVCWNTLLLQHQRNCLRPCTLVQGGPVSAPSNFSEDIWVGRNIFSLPFGSWCIPSVDVSCDVSKGTSAEGHSLTSSFPPLLFAANLPWAFSCVRGSLKFSGSKQEGFYDTSM